MNVFVCLFLLYPSKAVYLLFINVWRIKSPFHFKPCTFSLSSVPDTSPASGPNSLYLNFDWVHSHTLYSHKVSQRGFFLIIYASLNKMPFLFFLSLIIHLDNYFNAKSCRSSKSSVCQCCFLVQNHTVRSLLEAVSIQLVESCCIISTWSDSSQV